ncbi:MAG: GNAT family N-acetyltransferase [Ardenticatenaceae bacterium]|nr:GNAT family N-acetyltransferase [Ardenticatenaceae bacterium]
MVRPAQLSDVSRIAQVHVQAWQDAYRGLLPDSLLDGLSVEQRERWWRHTVERNRPHSGLFVVEDNEIIVGFSNWSRPKEGNSYTAEGELETIYLIQEAWGKRLGYELYVAVEAAALEDGCSSLGLWVLHNNQRAISFYERVGFKLEPEKVKIDHRGDVILREHRYTKSILPRTS